MAGGNATRMFPYSDIYDKSMLPIGGKPIIRIIVERLIQCKVCVQDEIVICCLGKHMDVFKHEFRDLPGIRYSPKVDAIGTASHYYYAAEIEQHLPEDVDVMVHYADCLTDLDYFQMVEVWEKIDPVPGGLIYVTKNVRHEYSEVQTLSEGTNNIHTVSDFVEKPMMAYHTWTGIAILRHGAVKEVVGNRILGKQIDFGRDVLPAMMKKGKLLAYQTDDAWYDAGTAHSYRRLRDQADRGDIFV